MSDKFTVEIISPDKSILKTNTSEVIIPSYEGEMGILKDHIPLITFLRPGLVSISGDNEKKFFLNNLHRIGYSKVNRTKKKFEYLNLIKAFQRKFRQDLVNGKADKECYLISKSIQNKR